VISLCLEKLHRHPAELENLPLWALWEIIVIAKMEAEEMEEKLKEG
jgi:hypothetical protein